MTLHDYIKVKGEKVGLRPKPVVLANSSEFKIASSYTEIRAWDSETRAFKLKVNSDNFDENLFFMSSWVKELCNGSEYEVANYGCFSDKYNSGDYTRTLVIDFVR